MTNFISVIKSSRFQQLFVIAVLQSLVLFNIISSDQGVGLINIISGLFGASVVIRTVDRQTDVKTAAATGTTTVSIPANVSNVTASTDSVTTPYQE